jgi:hypothetical protein
MTKLPYEKTDEELNASVKAEVKAFLKNTKADARAKQEKPYLMYPRVKLRQVVQATQDKKHTTSKKPAPPLSDYEHTISKKIKKDKRKQKATGKDVAQLDQQAQQSVPPLVVENQYVSNMNLMQMSVPDDVDLDELAKWMNVTGLYLEQLLGREELTTIKEAEVVDDWQRKYVYDRSLCDPAKVKNLGTQMYKLHKYYLRFCAQHQSEQYLGVQVRDRHYFHGDDVI